MADDAAADDDVAVDVIVERELDCLLLFDRCCCYSDRRYIWLSCYLLLIVSLFRSMAVDPLLDIF